MAVNAAVTINQAALTADVNFLADQRAGKSSQAANVVMDNADTAAFISEVHRMDYIPTGGQESVLPSGQNLIRLDNFMLGRYSSGESKITLQNGSTLKINSNYYGSSRSGINDNYGSKVLINSGSNFTVGKDIILGEGGIINVTGSSTLKADNQTQLKGGQINISDSGSVLIPATEYGLQAAQQTPWCWVMVQL